MYITHNASKRNEKWNETAEEKNKPEKIIKPLATKERYDIKYK